MHNLYTLEFELAGLPTLVNAQSRAHWAIQFNESKRWKRYVHHSVAGKQPGRPLERAKVTFTRLSTTQPDCDNLAASFKAIRDALIEAKIILNDSPKHIEAQYGWEKAKRGQGKVKVKVEEL